MNLFVLGGLSALGIVLMLALLHLIDVLQRKPVKAGPLAGRPEKSLKDFALEAGEVGVSLRVVRETYDLLMEHYPQPMSIDLRDELRRDLGISDKVLVDLRSTLFKKTDRVESGTTDVSSIRTVGELLTFVETARRDKVDRASLRLRASDCPYPVRPVAEVIEFKQSSQIMDPDYLRRAHFKWLRRRLSDYKGLLSRATDNSSKPAHMGPFRRSHEGPRYPSWNGVNPPNVPTKRAGDIILESAEKQSSNNEPASVSLSRSGRVNAQYDQAKTSTATASGSASKRYPVPAIRIAGPEYPSR